MATTSTDRRYGVNAGLAFKAPCKAATTANITLSGEQTIDGVALVTNDRCLVKNQTTASENGIYVVDTSSWELDRDWDGTRDVKKGTSVRVTDGTTNIGYWYVTTSDPITPGTTSVAFSRTTTLSSGVTVVATYADLQAINYSTLSANDTVTVLGRTSAGDGGGGDLYWVAGDQSANVTADTQSGIWVAPTSASTGASGAWKRVYSGAINAKWFGATGDGATNDRAAIAAAISFVSSAGGGTVFFPEGTYLCSSSFTVPNYVNLVGEGREATIIKRNFTGDFITSFGGYCSLHNLTINGDTATHGNGKGVLMPASSPSSYMDAVTIKNFNQSCLEFAADSGSGFRATGCEIYTTGTVGSVAAVYVNGNDTAATSRHFTGCESAGCTLYNFGGCNDFYVSGGYTNGLIFSSSSSKVLLTSMRVGADAGSITIDGRSHAISNCVFASDVTLAATSQNCFFRSEVPSYNITDSGTANLIVIPIKSYTATWTAATANPDIGNGSIVGSYSVSGREVTLTAVITMGSTTTYGTGAWRISLPFTAATVSGLNWVGQARALDSGTNFRIGTALVASAGTYAETYFDSAAAATSPTVPFTWAQNDILHIQITYLKA